MSDTTQFDSVRIIPPAHRALEVGLAALCLAIAASATLLYLQQPQLGVFWVGAALFLPALLLVVCQLPGIAACGPSHRTSLVRSFLGAGVLILVPLLLRLAEGLGWLDIGGVRRAVGVLLGGGLVLVGSYLPHRLQPFARQRFDVGLTGKLLRHSSAGVMIAGLGYGGVWLAAPLQYANLWASVILAIAAALTGLGGLLLVKHHSG